MNKLKVLIVDDETMVRDVLYDILDNEGYEVTAVANAVAALKSGAENNFDLLLTDIKMPAMNGLELIRRFRETNPQIVPVLITGYPDLETVTAAIQQGAYDYIVKPIDKKVLCSAVANALKNKSLATERTRAGIIPEERLDLTTESGERGKASLGNYLTPAEIVTTLRNSELFTTLSDDELQAVANLGTEEIYRENEAIYEQGGRSEKLYIIHEGSIALNKFLHPDRSAFVTIDILGSGKCFGWSALIEPHIHTTSALSLRLTRVITINGNELKLALQNEPRAGLEVMQKLTLVLAKRLVASYNALESKM